MLPFTTPVRKVTGFCLKPRWNGEHYCMKSPYLADYLCNKEIHWSPMLPRNKDVTPIY